MVPGPAHPRPVARRRRGSGGVVRGVLLLGSLFLLLGASPGMVEAQLRGWDARVEEVRRVTAGILATVEEMPGPEGSAEARDRWDRFARAVALEAARSWAVMARFGYRPPELAGLDWNGGRGVEERFVRSSGPWDRVRLRVLADRAFQDLVGYMEGLDAEELRSIDARSGRTQGALLAGLGVTFAAKLTVLEDWARRGR